jgi:DNA-binding NarL/FixJ family response regulator
MLTKKPDLKVVGHAKDGQEAINLAGELKPDVILMDINMPRISGIEATRAIHREHPDIRIIGLSMYEDPERAQAMRDAGAFDYKTKRCLSTELISAIRKCV